jgi:hypothetical protein
LGGFISPALVALARVAFSGLPISHFSFAEIAIFFFLRCLY